MAEYIVRGVPRSLAKDGWWLVETPVDGAAKMSVPAQPEKSGLLVAANSGQTAGQ